MELGPLTIHFYALCIITGIAISIWLGDKRLRTLNPMYKGLVSEVALVAVPAGIIGGRIYHVITSLDLYRARPLDAFKIWEGGLGIWGAISLGAVGAWLRFRTLTQTKPDFLLFLDALAPGLLFAQGIGRFGNWFNGELFGRPLDAPWALEIPIHLRPAGFTQYETFHPTFLYEALWCFLIGALLLKFRGGAGQNFSLYVMSYCIGRFCVEYLRIDPAHMIAGLRINNWVALIVGVSGYFAFRRFGLRVR